MTAAARDWPPAAPLAGLLLHDATAGLMALDVWLKEADAQVLFAGDVEPGHWLLLLTGELAALQAGFVAAEREVGEESADQLFLPAAHPQLLAALHGQLSIEDMQPADEPALGVVRSSHLLQTLLAVDSGLKAADVALLRLRFGTALHGRGEAAWFGGHDAVLAANAAAQAIAEAGTIRVRCLPRPLPDVLRAASQGNLHGALLPPLRRG